MVRAGIRSLGDMEEEMRQNGVPLFALESGDPVGEFDMVGFTLQYELSYTNMLNMLDLAGIPLYSAQRDSLSPLVVAGGPCVCNPEPVADFVDLFFLGEGEEVDLEIVELYRRYKKEGRSKAEFLRAAAQVEGVYVPSLYEVSYREDGTVAAVTPKEGAPARVRKRIVKDMNRAYFPETFVVPYLDIVHDRAVSEVQRGCYRACRFCQAGFIYRPVRVKEKDVIDQQCRDLCAGTGYDEISLSSLSTSDYPDIEGLLDTLLRWTKPERVNVSLPSLRVDGFSNELTEKIKTVRRSGLTFAPEAGTQRMRDVINKNVTEEELLQTVRTAFAGGWSSIKLYFMIGLPTETLDDVAGIADLGQAVVEAYYHCPDKPKGRGVNVTLSASSFVPKPFTPFQWEPQDSIETLRQKQDHLVHSVKSRRSSATGTTPIPAFWKGYSPGGIAAWPACWRKPTAGAVKWTAGRIIFPWRSGWKSLRPAGWIRAFYNQRRREFTEVLPWDHLDYGIRKDFLIEECRAAYENRTSPDCKEACSACGAACFQGGICFETR